MSYCKNCGKQIDDRARKCPYCGSIQDDNTYQMQPQVQEGNPLCAGTVGFCIPLVGIIMWLLWRNNKPKTASVALKAAILGVVLSVGVWVLAVIMGG